jgi:hypothetical protein
MSNPTSPPKPSKDGSPDKSRTKMVTKSSMASDLLIANLQNQPSVSSQSYSSKGSHSPKGEHHLHVHSHGHGHGHGHGHHVSGHHLGHSTHNSSTNNIPKPPADSAESPSPTTKRLFKKNIVGDLFGTSYGEHSLMGFMYRSRIIENADSKENTQEKKKEENLQIDSVVSSSEIAESESDSDHDTKMLKNMNPKQQLALTIKNWSAFPENDEHIIKEGAVYALIALSHMDDSTIRKCCASSFYHLSSREKNREELLAIGTTAGVITLAMQARNW